MSKQQGYEVLDCPKIDDVDRARLRRNDRVRGYEAPEEFYNGIGDSDSDAGGFARRNNVRERL